MWFGISASTVAQLLMLAQVSASAVVPAKSEDLCKATLSSAPPSAASGLAAEAAFLEAGEAAGRRGGGLSMLQLAASAQESLQLRRVLSARSRRSPGGAPISPVRNFKGVSMLCLQLPISEAFRREAANGMAFGLGQDPRPLELDDSGFAEVRIADFPDAQLGWKGTVGASEIENVPHRLLSVRLPILRGGEKMYQTVFALSDDDVAVLIYRMSSGIPAKLANISFPATASFPEGLGMNASRRSVNLFQAQNIRDVGEADPTSVEALFAYPEMNFGTELSNLLPLNSTKYDLVFKQLMTKATIANARKVDVELSIVDGSWDGFSWMLADSKPVNAWWVQADLEVTTTLVSEKRPTLGINPFSDALLNDRMLGEVLTEKEKPPKVKFAYTHGDVIWFTTKIDQKKVTPYLAPGLTLRSDEAVVWHVRWQPADILNMWGMKDSQHDYLDLEYNELWVTMPVTYRGRNFTYPILMLLDEDVGQMAGQDGGGCPKKLANLTYTFSPPPGQGSEVLLNVNRHERHVLNVTGKMSGITHKPIVGVNDNKDPAGEILFVMSHQFPWDPAVDRPKYFFVRGVQQTKEQRGLENLRVSYGADAPEPLAEWFVGEPIEGGYIRMNQDWLPSLDTPFDWQFEDVDPDEFVEWWKVAFPVLYM
mmetsp:Transcript_162004/g.514756  ORF Transcript_162004/g.514756 Transcript_162004/m.514756 type:complete len:651 (-) Transcript_162004:104-2056(-)